MDNLSLVEKVKKGNREAFNELYRAHYPSLRSYAGLLLGEEEADDVVQDVFLNVWLHKESLDDTLSIRGYLLRSVYNSALNVIKKRGRSDDYRSMYEKEVELIQYGNYDPDANDVIKCLYNQDLRTNINAAIGNLPARCREVFLLSYVQDLSSKEISSQLGISISTVENHIYSALKQLREKLISCKANGVLLLLFLLLLSNN